METRVLLTLIALVVLLGCSYVKPACTVIDIADDACEFYTVEYVDDNGETQRERVPKSELRRAAIRARAARVAP